MSGTTGNDDRCQDKDSGVQTPAPFFKVVTSRFRGKSLEWVN